MQIILFLVAILLCSLSISWSLRISSKSSSYAKTKIKTSANSFKSIAISSIIAMTTFISIDIVPTNAIAAETTSALLYKSGKNPVPNKDPNNKEGTKKDSSFLRCMSNCKSRCQAPSEGLAKVRLQYSSLLTQLLTNSWNRLIAFKIAKINAATHMNNALLR
jgi:hypothetical protein